MSDQAAPQSQTHLQFRLRGNEMNRIEAVSDVVFGFAFTLLVVSRKFRAPTPISSTRCATSRRSRLPSRC